MLATRGGEQRGYVLRHGCVPPGSTQDVQRRVVVPVERQATGACDPTGRKVEVLEHHTALRATTRRVGRVYEGHLTTGAFSLVREVLPECSPAAIEDALAQVVIADHITNAQVFQRNPVVLAHQLGTQLVQEVGTLRRDVRLLALHGPQRLLAVARAALSSCQLALQDPQPALPGAIEGRMRDLRPVAGRDERRNAHVNPDRPARLRQRLRFRHLAGEAGVPLPRLVLDADRLDRAVQWAMPAHAHAPDAVQLQATPVEPCAEAELLEQEAVVPTAPLKARIARLLTCLDAAKEGLESKVHLLDDALRGLAEHLVRVGERLAIVFRQCVQVRLAHAAPLKLVGVLALRQRHVVQPTTGVQHAPQVLFLRARRIQPIAVGSQHSDRLLPLDILLNHRQRRTADRRNKVAVCPQGRQAAFQVRELLPEQARATPLHALHKLVDAKLRVYFAQQVYVVRHDFQFQHLALCIIRHLPDDGFQSFIHAVHQHLAAILRTEDNVVLARIHHVIVALEFALLSHNSIIQQEAI